MSVFLEGLLIGLAYAMPIGAQNIFVINAAARGGLRNAVRVAGVIAAIDVSLAIACFLGMSQILTSAPILKPILSGGGALFLFWLGWSLLRSEPETGDDKTNMELSLLSLVKYGLVLTWLNPQALIDGSILFGSVQTSLPSESVMTFLYGSAAGSVLWFSTIAIVVGAIKLPMTKRTWRVINVACGLAMVAYGVKLGVQTAEFGRGLL